MPFVRKIINRVFVQNKLQNKQELCAIELQIITKEFAYYVENC